MLTATMAEPRAANSSPIARTATSSIPPTPCPLGVMPNSFEMVYRPANEPTMNTSEWAKLISWRTPYTIV